MRPLPLLLAVLALVAGAGSAAAQQDGCPAGTSSIILSPDGGTLTVLFDAFAIAAGGSEPATAAAICRLHVPLPLPENTSIGVYRVDYRGYARLAHQQRFELGIVYGFNAGRDHAFRRQLRGAHDDGFGFSQNIGAGLMKRVGCGETAALDIEATLSLDTAGRPGEAVAAMDSLDGAPAGGLVFRFDLRRC